MARYVWENFKGILFLGFIIWLISRTFGIDIIDWRGIGNVISGLMPSLLILGAIVYLIKSIFK